MAENAISEDVILEKLDYEREKIVILGRAVLYQSLVRLQVNAMLTPRVSLCSGLQQQAKHLPVLRSKNRVIHRVSPIHWILHILIESL